MIAQLRPVCTFFVMNTVPGFGLMFLSTDVIALVLLKWAHLWRWKVAGLLLPASWFRILVIGSIETQPPLWVRIIVLMAALLSLVAIPAMFAFGAHWWVIHRVRGKPVLVPSSCHSFLAAGFKQERVQVIWIASRSVNDPPPLGRHNRVPTTSWDLIVNPCFYGCLEERICHVTDRSMRDGVPFEISFRYRS